MFREFFGSEIERESAWCDFADYHVDGARAIKTHLPFLLEFPQIKIIQFTPGSGAAPTLSPQYIPVYRQILQRGKRLYLLAQPNEVEPLLTALSPKGLFLSTYADSEEEANALLNKVNALSAKRNIVIVG